MSTKLILIRHGETDWNRQKRYVGFTDRDLNKKGQKQAKRLSGRLRKESIQKVYSSDMKRARHSARIVFKGMSLEELPELREMNFGAFEGLTYQAIMKRHSEIYRKWLKNPLAVAVPQGESLKKMAQRVRKVLAKISSCNRDKTVAVFTHAGPIRVILCDILKIDLREIWQIKVNLGGIHLVKIIDGSCKGRLQGEVLDG